jgi:AraC-like DNA-binding protein
MGPEPVPPAAGHPQAEALDNPFRRRLVLLEDLQSSRELLGTVLPLREFRAAQPGEPWWHYGVNSWLGSVVVAAGILPPARMVSADQRRLTVFLGYGGDQQIRQASRRWSCPAEGCLMVPGDSFSWEGTLVSLLVFRLEPERLLQTASAMAGLGQSPHPWRALLQRPHDWPPASAANGAPLQALLRQEMALADRLAAYGDGLADRLQVDDRIYRLMAAMLLPEVREEGPLDRLTQKHRQGRDAFDELIDFIRLNLSEPLNLTMLEEHSHYSRRTLQYAFRERLGCTATQWIRSQRLDLARQHLQHPSPGDTIASIAARCGYRSLSLFSLEFQQRFHVKPSQLLREARSSLPPEVW